MRNDTNCLAYDVKILLVGLCLLVGSMIVTYHVMKMWVESLIDRRIESRLVEREGCTCE